MWHPHDFRKSPDFWMKHLVLMILLSLYLSLSLRRKMHRVIYYYNTLNPQALVQLYQTFTYFVVI